MLHRSVLSQPVISDDVLRVQQLLQGPLPPPSTTSQNPAQTGITLPSLWWIDRQFGEKLVIDWFAYDNEIANQQQVQVYIRSNLWTRFSYLERYAFISHFGSLTRTYGYQLVLIGTQGNALASYLCEFETQQPQIVLGAQTAQRTLVRSYAGQTQRELPCSLWMNEAFPRTTL